jgi:hypothetical protein
VLLLGAPSAGSLLKYISYWRQRRTRAPIVHLLQLVAYTYAILFMISGLIVVAQLWIAGQSTTVSRLYRDADAGSSIPLMQQYGRQWSPEANCTPELEKPLPCTITNTGSGRLSASSFEAIGVSRNFSSKHAVYFDGKTAYLGAKSFLPDLSFGAETIGSIKPHTSFLVIFTFTDSYQYIRAQHEMYATDSKMRYHRPESQ